MNGRDYWDTAVTLSPLATRFHDAAAVASPYDANPLELTIMVYCHEKQVSVVDTLSTIVEAMQVIDKPYEIIVVDDASKDMSARQVHEFIDSHPNVNIVLCSNRTHKGFVRSYVDAAFIGCGKYFRSVRADDGESMEAMVDVFSALGDADIILPYSIPSDDNAGVSVIAGICRAILNMLNGQSINEYSSSQIHLRYNIMRWHPGIYGPAFHIDLLCRLLALGFTSKQVPTRNTPRRDGHVSADAVDALALLHVIWRRITGKILD